LAIRRQFKHGKKHDFVARAKKVIHVRDPQTSFSSKNRQSMIFADILNFFMANKMMIEKEIGGE